jgi:flagellar biosynthesis protein FlhF
MQYLVEQGSSHREVLEKVRARYGDAAQVLSHRMIRSGGFLGMFTREGVEITFYLKDDAIKESEKKKIDVEEEKRRLLERMNQEKRLAGSADRSTFPEGVCG